MRKLIVCFSLAGLFLSCSNQPGAEKTVTKNTAADNQPVEKNEEILPSPPPPPPPHRLTKEEIAQLPKDYQDFMKRNPSVSFLHWIDKKIHVMLKNGTLEDYELNEQGIIEAEAKYGKLPAPPPPLKFQ